MATTSLLPQPKARFFTAAGLPLASGKVYFYEAGSSTPKDTFTDYSGTVLNTNPVILDANGEADIWLGSGLYKVVLKNSADVIQWTVDNVSAVGGSGSVVSNAVNVIADMTALTAPTSGINIVQVLGYSERPGVQQASGYTQKADAGGGLFYYNLTSVLADDGGIVFTPDSAPATGRWIRVFDGPVSVNWFGAIPDYILDNATVNPSPTDNTAAINAALAYGRANDLPVKLPAGIYQVSGAIICATQLIGDQKPQVTTNAIWGDPSWGTNTGSALEGSIIIWDKTLTTSDIYLRNAAAEPSQTVNFQNIAFMSKSFAGEGGGTLLVSDSNQTVSTSYNFGLLPTFQNCMILNFNLGIKVESSNGADYNNIEFRGCAQTVALGVITTDSAESQDFNNCIFNNCGTATVPFIKIENTFGVNFNRCYFETTSQIAIRRNVGIGLSFNQCYYRFQKAASGPGGITSVFLQATAEASADAGSITFYKCQGHSDAGDIDLSASPVVPKLTIIDSNLKTDASGSNLILGATLVTELGYVNYGTVTGTSLPNKITTDEASLQGIRFENTGLIHDIGLTDATLTNYLRLTATNTGATTDGAKIEMFGNAYGSGTADLNLLAGTGSNGGDINLTPKSSKSVILNGTLSLATIGINTDLRFTANKGLALTRVIGTAANGFMSGVATLVAGTVTVTCNSITGSDIILLTHYQALGTLGVLSSSQVASTSFTITSSNAADVSLIGWIIVHS